MRKEIKIVIAIIIVTILGYFLSISVDPAEKKPFFEIQKDGSNSSRITVTGNEE